MSRRAGERGAALVMTLVFAAAMAAAAVAFTQSRQSDSLALRAQVQAVEAKAMLEAALQQTAALLANRTSRQTIPRSLTWSFGGAQVNVRIEAETSRIDLNAAEESLLQALPLALGISDDQAMAFAQTVLDWRDDNSERRTNGAEDRDYDLDEQGSSGAGDRPFANAAELRYLPGVDARLWAQVAPLVTVYSGAASPNRLKASPTVRRVMAIAQGLASAKESEDSALDASEDGQEATGDQGDGETGLGSGGGTGFGNGGNTGFGNGGDTGLGNGGGFGGGRGSGFDRDDAGAGMEPGRRSFGADDEGSGASGAPRGSGFARNGSGFDRDSSGLGGQDGAAADEVQEAGTTTEDAVGAHALFLDVRFPNGYEAAARAVIAFGQAGGSAPPFTVLDWTPMLREQSGTR
jgi:general secretion pathway protein K